MRRLVLGLVVAIACGPAVGDGDGDGDGGSTSQSDSSSGRAASSSAGDASSDITVTDGTTTSVDDTGGVLFDVGGPASSSTTSDPCELFEPCPLPGDAFAEVAGTTPLGQVDAAFAWSGMFHGECGGTRVFMMPSVEAFEAAVVCGNGYQQPDPSLMLFFSGLNECVPFDEEATLTHLVDGVEASTPVQLELTSCEVARDIGFAQFGGEFTASGDDWELTGTFVAPHCSHVDVGCP
jgi:hypothetical protein